MILYPAIDLLEGRCVRLYKGDFEQSKVYSEDPVAMAKDIQAAGASWLHLVDLEGAKNPENRQTDLIESIVSQTDLKVQTGGGIREEDDIAQLLDAGVSRVVIGSLAVKEQERVVNILNKFGAEKITLAFDVHMDEDEVYRAATSGWQEKSSKTLNELIEFYLRYDLTHVLCTDIDRDGTMEGSNVQLYNYMTKLFKSLQVQASGGVDSLQDLRALEKAGVAGAVVGKALYEGAFTVEDALGTLRAA